MCNTPKYAKLEERTGELGVLAAGPADRKGSGGQRGHSLFSWFLQGAGVLVLWEVLAPSWILVGSILPELPPSWILMSGLWRRCLINLQRPPVGWPRADKAVICSGGLGLTFSSPEGTGAGSPYSSCTLPSAPGIGQGT